MACYETKTFTDFFIFALDPIHVDNKYDYPLSLTFSTLAIHIGEVDSFFPEVNSPTQ